MERQLHKNLGLHFQSTIASCGIGDGLRLFIASNFQSGWEAR
jgi:hypothetical protein